MSANELIKYLQLNGLDLNDSEKKEILEISNACGVGEKADMEGPRRY